LLIISGALVQPEERQHEQGMDDPVRETHSEETDVRDSVREMVPQVYAAWIAIERP